MSDFWLLFMRGLRKDDTHSTSQARPWLSWKLFSWYSFASPWKSSGRDKGSENFFCAISLACQHYLIKSQECEEQKKSGKKNQTTTPREVLKNFPIPRSAVTHSPDPLDRLQMISHVSSQTSLFSTQRKLHPPSGDLTHPFQWACMFSYKRSFFFTFSTWLPFPNSVAVENRIDFRTKREMACLPDYNDAHIFTLSSANRVSFQ